MTRFKNILKCQKGTSFVSIKNPYHNNVNHAEELYKDVSPGNLYNDKYVSEFFQYDVLPRYIRENPKATKRQINRVRNAYKQYPQYIMEHMRKGASGVTRSLLPFIAYKPEESGGVDRTTIVHENTHAYRSLSPFTNMITKDEKKYLDDAYNRNYKVRGINISPYIHDTQEKIASKAETRYQI
jgi:hypothetical protein